MPAAWKSLAGRDLPRKRGGDPQDASSPNAVHITTLTRILARRGRVLLARLRVGNLLTLRLTALGLWRPRLGLTRPSRISVSTASWTSGLG